MKWTAQAAHPPLLHTALNPLEARLSWRDAVNVVERHVTNDRSDADAVRDAARRALTHGMAPLNVSVGAGSHESHDGDDDAMSVDDRMPGLTGGGDPADPVGGHASSRSSESSSNPWAESADSVESVADPAAVSDVAAHEGPAPVHPDEHDPEDHEQSEASSGSSQRTLDLPHGPAYE